MNFFNKDLIFLHKCVIILLLSKIRKCTLSLYMNIVGEQQEVTNGKCNKRVC